MKRPESIEAQLYTLCRVGCALPRVPCRRLDEIAAVSPRGRLPARLSSQGELHSPCAALRLSLCGLSSRRTAPRFCLDFEFESAAETEYSVPGCLRKGERSFLFHEEVNALCPVRTLMSP